MNKNKIFDRITNLLDLEDYNQARKLVEQTLKETTGLKPDEKLIIELNLFGLLIDIGCESRNETDLNKAIDFFEAQKDELLKIITKASYYYNLANAKHGLGKIFYSTSKGVHSLSTTKDKFQEPINLYWLAYKAIDNNEDFLLIKILINLSNSLINVSRIVEALQFLDIVLRPYPNYPQALVSRGDDLNYLSQVTNCSLTTVLFAQIYQSYDKAINTDSLPPSILKECIYKRESALKTIQNHGFDISNLDKEYNDTRQEYDRHTDFRKFCIDNFLTLNEHGVYCICVAAEKDDLQIGVKHAVFKGDVVPKLELLLNRMKSEFAFARWMYYKSNSENPFDYDAKFSELLDGEVINSQTETLRTSFRICYGILDKIALGICKLYGIDSKRVHFETFFDDKKKNRKDEFDKIRNIHLNAIYSIACDLNTQTGELRHFKNWRNKLEHNLLVLKDNNDFTPDVLRIFEDEEFIAVADIDEFNQKTLHLLQLTRSAIFSYVYCVRLQTIEHKPDNHKGNGFNVGFKV